MDIISYGKASKALKDIEKLSNGTVGAKAENRFTTVDGRLDWIESQYTNLSGENELQVDLSKATLTDTEFKDGKILLKKVSEETYLPSGTWESGIIDLGSGWQKTTSLEVK